MKLNNMDVEQFTIIKNLLEEIKELLKQNQQSSTKITVVGSKPKTNPKGLQNTDDFTL
jgi:dihydroneopterin aldolase